MIKRILAMAVCFFGFLSSLFSASASAPGVSAQSAILICADTGTVLAEYNAYERLPMASTTKIMTALLLAETDALDTEIVTTKEMVTVEGSSMGLLEGDRVTYRDLLYGMLLASGNDAANTTAICLGGSVAGFAEMMNAKAAELGLNDTHFVTPSGLDDENHYTTASDLARLAAYALQNPVFAEAVAAKSATLTYGNPPYRRTLSNHNKLLSYYEDCIGVKTGYTKRSGRCLVSAAKQDGATIVAVTLNDRDDWDDHQELLDYGFSLMKSKIYTADVPESIPVVGGDQSTVGLDCADFSYSLPSDDADAVTDQVYLEDFLYAPVSAGDVVGRVEYSVGDTIVGTVDITVSESSYIQDYVPPGKSIFYYIKLLLSK